MAPTKTPLVQSAADAPVRPVAGGSVAVRLRGEHTGGSLALVQNVLPAGFGGVPLHVHPPFDEGFYVVGGGLTFPGGPEGVTATARSPGFRPRGRPPTLPQPAR